MKCSKLFKLSSMFQTLKKSGAMLKMTKFHERLNERLETFQALPVCSKHYKNRVQC